MILKPFGTVDRRQKAGNDEQNVPNGWTVKDGGMSWDMIIMFQKVGKSGTILQNLLKTFLSEQTYQLKSDNF